MGSACKKYRSLGIAFIFSTLQRPNQERAIESHLPRSAVRVDKRGWKLRATMSCKLAEIFVPKYWIERAAHLNRKKGHRLEMVESDKETLRASDFCKFTLKLDRVP